MSQRNATMPLEIETAQEVEERYADLFKKLDKGGDGRIDIKDLTGELKELGVCESYAEVSFSSTENKCYETVKLKIRIAEYILLSLIFCSSVIPQCFVL